MPDIDGRTISQTSYDLLLAGRSVSTSPTQIPPPPAPPAPANLSAYDVYQAKRFIAEGWRTASAELDENRLEAARRVLAALVDTPWPTPTILSDCREILSSITGFSLMVQAIAKHVIAAVPPQIVAGRGWIDSDDDAGNTREAFVELATPASAPQVLATVGIESRCNAPILALRMGGEFVEEFSWDGPSDWARARTRAEELVGEAPAT